MSDEAGGLIIFGALILCCVVLTLALAGVAVAFALHVRSERKGFVELTKESLRHMAARTAKDAAEAKALEMYQEEAIREQRDAYEATKSDDKLRGVFSRDTHGSEYEVIAGIDDYATGLNANHGSR
jgi:hypothetical protein